MEHKYKVGDITMSIDESECIVQYGKILKVNINNDLVSTYTISNIIYNKKLKHVVHYRALMTVSSDIVDDSFDIKFKLVENKEEVNLLFNKLSEVKL